MLAPASLCSFIHFTAVDTYGKSPVSLSLCTAANASMPKRSLYILNATPQHYILAPAHS